MSNRQSDLIGVRFEPVSDRKDAPPAPGQGLLVLGVIYPAAVIALELFSHMCANAFFDPMPTYWHVAALALVPLGNLLIWWHLQDGARASSKWLAFANGAALAIAGCYALLFLPLLPLALVGILIVVGILPLAPIVAFVCTLRLRAALRRHDGRPSTGPLLAGLAAGLALLLVADIQPAATRLGLQWAKSTEPSERARGLSLLRTLGDDDLLLRLCYGAAGQPTGLLSALVMFGDDLWVHPHRRTFALSPADAREIYYRVHGVPFNAKPAPTDRNNASQTAGFQFDDDHGGTQVGGRLKGLHLVSSRIDGSVSGDDAVAYLEWTVEFRNAGLNDLETRLQVALPPGGVVSRATLWVNGKEREAAYGGRGEVRAAYQRVAVQQRRDPLLVTTKGADRVLAQAFPVPRNSGTIKFKLGISAPLEIIDVANARLTLPALIDRNFSLSPHLNHSVWIESRQALAASTPSLTSSRVDGRLFRLSGAVGDRELARTRQTVTVERNPNAGARAVRIGDDGELIVQDLVRSQPPVAPILMLVVDGSARLADAAEKLITALEAVPPNTSVGAIIASEPLQRVAPAPWSGLQKRAVMQLLRSTSFVGGQDNAPALAEALGVLESETKATLLWVHGPQPVSFRESATRLEQTAARLSRLPEVILYSVEPGPNELLPDAPWAWGARSLPQTGALDADLAGFFKRALGPADRLVPRRAQDQAAEGLPSGSGHIARLWAHDRVLELMRADPTGNRSPAVALASRYRLVTPVSGAVVLETQQQYQESGLTPVSPTSVPTAPEPHEWALMLIACAALLWMIRRHRQTPATAAAA